MVCLLKCSRRAIISVQPPCSSLEMDSRRNTPLDARLCSPSAPLSRNKQRARSPCCPQHSRAQLAPTQVRLTLNSANQAARPALDLARSAVDCARGVAGSVADGAGGALGRALDLGQALGGLGLHLGRRLGRLLLCGAGGLGRARCIAQARATDGEPRLAHDGARYSERHGDGADAWVGDGGCVVARCSTTLAIAKARAFFRILALGRSRNSTFESFPRYNSRLLTTWNERYINT